MKAIAKHDVKVLMKDGRFSDFREGEKYRCMLRGNGAILIDENKTGFLCEDMETFEADFELITE